MIFTTSEMITILVAIFSGGSIYGLIRADLMRINEKFIDIKEDLDILRSSTARAHERVNEHVTIYHARK